MKHVFIVNTHAGNKNFSDKLRKTLEEEDFEYYIFTTRRKVKEGRLVRNIASYFKGEKVRVYCCGGSGTFRNVINNVENLDDVEFAFYPCGLTNDFLKVFGQDEKYFHDIKNLIHGRVEKIDYIQSNHGRCVNALAIGMDTDTLEGMERYRSFNIISGKIPYFLSILYALFGIKNIDYDVTIDDEQFSGKFFEVCFANGFVIGGNVEFGLTKCVNNGKANVFIGPKVNTLTILPHVLLTTSGKPEKTIEHGAKIMEAKRMTIQRKDRKPFAMDFDGEVRGDFDYWEAEIIHNGLNFVVPKQVNNGIMKEEA